MLETGIHGTTVNNLGLVIEFPEVYRCIRVTDIDKTYEMPKSCVSYRKKRRLSEKQRELKSLSMQKINSTN